MWSLAPGLQGTPPAAAEVGGLSCLLRGWCLVSQDEVGSVCLNCAVTESMRLPRLPGCRESLCIRDSDMRKPCAREKRPAFLSTMDRGAQPRHVTRLLAPGSSQIQFQEGLCPSRFRLGCFTGLVFAPPPGFLLLPFFCQQRFLDGEVMASRAAHSIFLREPFSFISSFRSYLRLARALG